MTRRLLRKNSKKRPRNDEPKRPHKDGKEYRYEKKDYRTFNQRTWLL
ncbi:MAG: hypothetical protein FWG98_05415 [Candidatus Cloacimonetes bacterium]|nr:hypothetical protein [Candidatus Cloacimonadota bacterium]